MEDPAHQKQLAELAHRHSAEGPNWGLAPAAKWGASLLGLIADGDRLKEASEELSRLLLYAEEGDWAGFANNWRRESLSLFR